MEVRKRLKTDFPLYARHALKIRTKTQEIVPLVLNEAQQILQRAIDADMKRRGYIRIIILKGRQQGLSTMVGGFLYFSVSQRRASKAMVVTHHAEATKNLFDMTKRFHNSCPEVLKPSTKYSSRKELSFDSLDSAYVVATAGGE
jgi:phage terminase large subunit-like protein